MWDSLRLGVRRAASGPGSTVIYFCDFGQTACLLCTSDSLSVKCAKKSQNKTKFSSSPPLNHLQKGFRMRLSLQPLKWYRERVNCMLGWEELTAE